MHKRYKQTAQDNKRLGGISTIKAHTPTTFLYKQAMLLAIMQLQIIVCKTSILLYGNEQTKNECEPLLTFNNDFHVSTSLPNQACTETE